jgi:hypothetical protein
LAAGAISRTDGVSVELRLSSDSPPLVHVLWPPRATELSPTPQAIAYLGRNVIQVLAAAQAELVRLGRRRHIADDEGEDE